MGSFNMGCGLTNLSIDYGDKVGVMLIIPNRWNDHTKNVPFYFATDALYTSFHPPFYGTYDDYGTVTDIQKNDVTDALEKLFGISVEQLLTVIGDDRGLYDSYSGAAKVFMDEKLLTLLNGYNYSTEEMLLAAGFTLREPNTFAYDEWVYSVVETRSTEGILPLAWSLSSSKKKHELYGVLKSGNKSEALENFAKLTGIQVGYSSHHVQLIQKLRMISPMFFLERPFRELEKLELFEVNLDHLRKELTWFITEEFMDEEIWLSMAYASGLFRNRPELTVAEVRAWLSCSEKARVEVERIFKIQWATNRLLMPSFNGEQFGNTEAMLALLAASEHVLTERLAREREDEME